MSFIRILEPWGGGHHEFDTGYGNRVQHWETLHKLQNIQGSDHSIQVEANYWQELKYVNFPGISPYPVWHSKNQTQAKISKWDYSVKEDSWVKLTPLTDKMVDEIIDGKPNVIKENVNYYTAFSWDKVPLLLELDTKYHYLPKGSRQMHIRDSTFRGLFFKTLGTNTIGIHVRRGSGVFKTKKEMLEFSDTLKTNKLVNQENAQSRDSIYTYINNKKIISVLKELIADLNNPKFYVSTDMPLSELKIIFDNFPDTVFHTREDFIKLMPEYIRRPNDFHFDNILESIAINTVVDQAALRTCKVILGHPTSTWTRVAAFASDIRVFYLNTPIDKLLDQVKNALKSISKLT